MFLAYIGIATKIDAVCHTTCSRFLWDVEMSDMWRNYKYISAVVGIQTADL